MVGQRAESSLNNLRSDDTQRCDEQIYKFRNYVPQSKFLCGLSKTSTAEPLSINHLIQDKLDLVPKDGNYRIDHQLLEPKKDDWDLKRRFERRLAKLEDNTGRAIASYVKERKEQKRLESSW